MNSIAVIGSINVDIVLSVKEHVKPGETILASEMKKVGGGKGANQAVAAARLGSKVYMLSCVGEDDNGEMMKKSLEKDGIDVSGILTQSTPTGIALIAVDSHAENSIIVVPGANYEMTEKYIDDNTDILKKVDMVILQNEIPTNVVIYALKKAKELGKITVFNNAPAKKIDKNVFKYIDYLVVNETELMTLTDGKLEPKLLLEQGVKNVILTLGKNGSKFVNLEHDIFVPARKVNAVDTTAAGDAFIGAFFSSFTGDYEKSLKYATKVSALTVQKPGAQSSLPYKEEVNLGGYDV